MAAAAAVDLKDSEYAKRLYSQAADKMEKAEDLMVLAKSLIESLKVKPHFAKKRTHYDGPFFGATFRIDTIT